MSNTAANPDSPYLTPAVPHAAVQQAAPAMPTSTVLAQVSSVLGGILLLILFIGWVAKRTGFAPQSKNNKLLKVTASCQVGRGEKVVVVEVGGDDVNKTWLVLGVTSHQITPLHTLSAPPVLTTTDNVTTSLKPADFGQLLKKVLKRPGSKE